MQSRNDGVKRCGWQRIRDMVIIWCAHNWHHASITIKVNNVRAVHVGRKVTANERTIITAIIKCDILQASSGLI